MPIPQEEILRIGRLGQPDGIRVRCANCSSVITVGEDSHAAEDYAGYLFCANCVEQCNACEYYFRWIGDHQYRCAQCQGTFCSSERSGEYCNYCDRWQCYDCGECLCRIFRRSVHAWDYRPHPFKPKGEYPNKALLGMELEVGGTEASIVPVVRQFDDQEDHLYMKRDGSICGVEIVSHPMTLEWAKTFPFTELVEGLAKNNCYVNEGYGLHVHVSRNAFRRVGKRSAPHQMAWLMFLYRNSEFLEKLARRTSDRWASFRKPLKGELKHKAEIPGWGDDRYVAINCLNARTYEMRFFASTLVPQEFWAALEFADAGVEYTRGLKTEKILRGNALNWDKFGEWVENQFQFVPEKELKYPNLLKEMVARAS